MEMEFCPTAYYFVYKPRIVVAHVPKTKHRTIVIISIRI